MLAKPSTAEPRKDPVDRADIDGAQLRAVDAPLAPTAQRPEAAPPVAPAVEPVTTLPADLVAVPDEVRLRDGMAPAAEVPAAAPAAVHDFDERRSAALRAIEPESAEADAAEEVRAAAPPVSELPDSTTARGRRRPAGRGNDRVSEPVVHRGAEGASVKAARSQVRRKPTPTDLEPSTDSAPAGLDSAIPADGALPSETAPPDSGPQVEEQLVVAEGEEIRVCEWEKCGKRFVVRTSGRTVVRRFCSGTCRGRASEARTGKR